ncbi:Telomere-associated protein Rif [Heracleum sosnowskyi]|uniref:Telomere-associated protein Rif n=1 Tax=Heracleum sosnowskyi TaxID=360622 RepID=A0AAD8JHZ9_9APIA|nr:Telomere-associated protein Rif [Heracleum sosnowskyi]
MANFTEQLKKMKTLLTTSTSTAASHHQISEKPFAYSTLLHLQEQATNDPALIQLLADSFDSLISFILVDVSAHDEEIAAQALKCLGFMVYHPSIVSVVSANDASLIVEILEKVITSTRIKSVCNLGVWCISIQQLNSSFLADKHHSLLRAIIHALDNPIGSLSTTFEAMQAVGKLTTQLSDMMKDTSHVWAPPIYRRLLSVDKRERDMAQRCLLKIKSTVYPPALALSKAVSLDMKRKLLPTMKELLSQGLKIQTLQAWGWFIRLMGPYAMKNRHLINDMLKIPEQTFSDLDPQVQIASQVAWEGLIDALIQPPKQAPETKIGHIIDKSKISLDSNEFEPDRQLKRIKLIMTPLTGIMSSKCDVSVHLSCLKTWCYFLQKLDTFVNCPSVIKFVWEPMLEVVLQIRPDNKNMLLLSICTDLLDNFALTRSKDLRYDLNDQISSLLSAEIHIPGPLFSGESSWKHCSIKWLPWDLTQLDFYTKMLHILISHSSVISVAPEIKSLLCAAALRIFRTVLRGVKNILMDSSITYEDIMVCIRKILMFVNEICEGAVEDCENNYIHHISLQFVKAVTEELDTSTLGSPLYKVALNSKYISNLRTVSEFRQGKMPGTLSVDHLNMSTPIVCLTVYYISVVIKLTLDVPKAGSIIQGMSGYLCSVLSSYSPLEILQAINSLLYKHFLSECLDAWVVVANCLKDYLDSVKDLSVLETESDKHGYIVLCHFLSHPIAVFSCPRRQLSPVKTNCSLQSSVSLEEQRKHELEKVVEVWKLLYASVNGVSQYKCFSSKSFSEDLCSMLNWWLDERRNMLESDNELIRMESVEDHEILYLCGEIAISVLEQTMTHAKERRTMSEEIGGSQTSNSISSILQFASRYVILPWKRAPSTSSIDLAVVSRVFSALVHFVSSICFQEQIISFMEIMGQPLCEWISHPEAHNESSKYQLQLLWVKILNNLRSSWPPINFDSSFLKLQAPLLESTLDHPNNSISEPTMKFWNSTYGEQIQLNYPKSLIPILDKLSRNGAIKLCRSSHFKLDGVLGYKVTATPNPGSKRVELAEGTQKDCQHSNSSLKRKRPELTEHQKEVRRAQQGRVRDCDGRGPGIRTYTSVDFSQGNEESQESQEIRNADAILEMLRKDSKLP